MLLTNWSRSASLSRCTVALAPPMLMSTFFPWACSAATSAMKVAGAVSAGEKVMSYVVPSSGTAKDTSITV